MGSTLCGYAGGCVLPMGNFIKGMPAQMKKKSFHKEFRASGISHLHTNTLTY